MNYNHLKGPEGRDNQGGTEQIIYAAPLSAFAANGIKGFKTTDVAGDSVTIDGNHTFKANEGFVELYTTLDTGKLTAELTGERDGRGYMLKLEAAHPGNSKEAAEFFRRAKNDSFIVLVPMPNGEVVQIGRKGIGADIAGKYDSGTLSSGRNGYTCEISAYANGLQFYEGTIEIKGAVV